VLSLARYLPAAAAALLIVSSGGAHASRPLEKAILTLQWLTQCQFAGYYVGLEKGYYRDEGIDLVIRPGASDSNPIQTVTVGAAHFGTRWFADLVKAVDGGAPVLSLAQIFGSSGLVLVTRADSAIRHPRDFVGKRVGIWFFGNEVQFYALMRQSGVDVAKVKVSPLQTSLKPFLSRELDVINTMTYNELPALLRAGVKRSELRVFDFADFGLDFPGDVLFTRRALLKERPDLARRMVRASLRGWADALKDPEGAVRIVLKHDRSGNLDPAHQRFQMAEVARLVRVGGRALGAHSAQDVDRVAGILANNGLIARAPRHEDIYTNDLLR
jgi:NitT/TauT family transport system substrate-binding protein